MAAEEVCLTRGESLEYLQRTLNIHNAELRLKTEARILLDDVVGSYHQVAPIQSITLHLVPVDKRRRPSWTQLKENILSGFGGLCYELNIFMYALLKGLGYDAYIVDAAVKRPSNHVMTVVRNISKPGELFLVDAGCGFPTFQAVDLNFLEESPEYQQSFMCYKFVKQNGKILRMHKPREKENDGWKRYYDFELTPLNIDELNLRFDKVFEDPESTSSHRVLRCTVFLGHRACALKNNVILRENEQHILEETAYDCDDDLAAVICETFSVFKDKEAMVKESIRRWRDLLLQSVNKSG